LVEGHDDSLFSCAADTKGSNACAAVFGFGKILPESFLQSSIGCGWTLERVKQSAACAYARSCDASRATVFGAGSVELPENATAGSVLRNWTGRFDGENMLAAVAIVEGDSESQLPAGGEPSEMAVEGETSSQSFLPRCAAAVFGVPEIGGEWADPLACNWTIDFIGRENITAIGYGGPGEKVLLGTLGGYRNGSSESSSEGMRFYFRGPGTSVVAALRLRSAPQLESDSVSLELAEEEFSPQELDSWPRAIAIGPNFQLNVGRMPAFPNEGARNRETEESIFSGGETFGMKGTLYILGAVARAVGSPISAEATMRIDSDWTVNCFGPVQDWTALEIFNGRLVLSSGSDAATALAVEMAMSQQQAAAAAIAASPSCLFPQGDNLVISHERFVPKGRLTVGDGESLILHLDGSFCDLETPFPFRRSGRIECVGPCPTDGWITFQQNANLIFAEDSAQYILGSSSSNALPLGFLVLMANGALTAQDVFGGTLQEGARVTGTDGCYRISILPDGPKAFIRRHDNGESLTSLATVADAGLFWCRYADFSGLMICEEAFPHSFEALRKVFSLGRELERRMGQIEGQLQELKLSAENFEQKMEALAKSGALLSQSKTLATVQDLAELEGKIETLASQSDLLATVRDLAEQLEGRIETLAPQSALLVLAELEEKIETLTTQSALSAAIQDLLAELEGRIETLATQSALSAANQNLRKLKKANAKLTGSVTELQSALSLLTQQTNTFLSKREFQDFIDQFFSNEGGGTGGSEAQADFVLKEGILAQAKGELLEVCGRTALQHMIDAPGNGLFGSIFGGTFCHDPEEKNEFARRDRFFGVLIGEGYVTDLPADRIRCAVLLGYGCDDVRISMKNDAGKDKNVFRQECVAEFAAIYGHAGYRRRPLDLQILFGCGIGVNDPYDGDGRGKKSPTRYYDLGLFSEVGIAKDLLSGGPVLMGPWAEFRYDHVSQRAHDEGVAGGTVHIPQMRHDFLTGRAGFRITVEPRPVTSAVGLRLCGRFGWEWQPLQRSTAASQDWQATTSYHSRNAVIGAVGLRTLLGEQWEFCAEVTGTYSQKEIFGVANFSLNCLF
jgi:hypothetical protein